MNKKIKVITGSLLTVFLLTITLVTGSVKLNAASHGYTIWIEGTDDTLLESTPIEFNEYGTTSIDVSGTVTYKNVNYTDENNDITIYLENNNTIWVEGTDDTLLESTPIEFNEYGTISIYASGTVTYKNVNYTDENNDITIYITKISATEDNKRPAISGQENFVTSVDDAKPVSFFQSFLTAIDETDGEVPVYIISDNYTANKSVLGTHKVVFGAKDLSGNEATLEAYIRVVDITKPVINGNASVVKIGYKETWNITNFKSTLTVSDNYDTLTSADITVKTDGYTANKSKLGTYNVVYAVKDKSGNEGTFTKPVQVYDNVRPTFSGPSTIATSNTTILTESDVRAQLTANDEIDGNLTQKIKLVEDNFTGKGNKVGSYTIKYSVTDNAGNTAEFIVTIQRSDKLPPVIWIQDGVSIKTTSTTPLSFEVIIEILQATGQVSSSTTTKFINEYDEYTGNENTPGIYAMSIRARSVDGNESLHNMSITVLDDTNDDGITTNPGFNINTWIKENPAWASIIAVASLAMIVIIVKKTKK